MRLAVAVLLLVFAAACTAVTPASSPSTTAAAAATPSSAPSSRPPTPSSTPTSATATPRASPRETPNADDQRIVAALVAFARARDARTFAALPLSDPVGLALDDQIALPRSASVLRSAEGWQLDVNFYRERAGPFSALDLLARDESTTVTIGPHPPCPGPLSPTPAALADMRRIVVQPMDVDTCVKWWAVDIYVSVDGRIRTVALDLGSP